MTRIFISAGEASGDLHASTLIRELKARNDGLEFFGLGGELMRAAGAELWYDLTVLAVTGFWEVVKKYFSFRRIFYNVLDRLDRAKPDVAILVDYPGFNLRIAKKLHQRGIKVIYYIAPQVWAWKERRVKDMERSVDLLVSILPFEEEFFSRTEIRCKFVGHPLLDDIATSGSAQEFRKSQGLDSATRIIALLPGSRLNEIESHYETMLRAIEQLRQAGQKFVACVLTRPEIDRHAYKTIEEKVPGISIKHVETDRYGLLKAADVAIVKSGTSTLETALCGTPFCIVYRMGWISYQIARRVIKLKNVGMVNIVAGEVVAPEFLQYEMTADNLSEFCSRILTSKEERARVQRTLEDVRHKLGEPGAAARAAEAIIRELAQ